MRIAAVLLCAIGISACTQADQDKAHAEAERTRVEARKTAQDAKVEAKEALHDASAEAKKAGREINDELVKAREKTREAIHEHTRDDNAR